MNIIIEGPDNSGKSTLVSYLSKVLQMPIVEGKGPPKSVDEINNRVISYSQYEGVIFDRHPAISNPIYDVFRGVSPQIREDILQEFFFKQEHVIVFCRGDRTLDTHEVKQGESPDHIAMVEKNHQALCDLYDAWALSHADILYNKHRTRVASVAKMLTGRLTTDQTMMGDMLEFHTKFGLVYDGVARHLSEEIGSFRANFLQEELDEYNSSREAIDHLKAKGELDRGEYTHQLSLQMDALVDLVYVAMGTAYLQGFPFDQAWRRVHDANMRKVRAARSEDSKRGSAFDVIKPPGWEPPYHTDLVEVNDYEA